MTAAVIPVRNEPADELELLVKRLRPIVSQVFIIDDSDVPVEVPDAWVADGAGTLGGSLTLGLEIASHKSDRVAVIDVGSHNPDDLTRLLVSDADVVIGSRFCFGGEHRGTGGRRTVSRLAALAYNSVSGERIHDWTSGFRVYSRRAVQAILRDPPVATRHAWQAEALAACLRAHCSYQEIPIVYEPSPSSLNSKAVREAVSAAWRIGWA